MIIGRKHWHALAACLVLAGTGLARGAAPTLTVADVKQIVGQAIAAANSMHITGGVVAVSDREGFILGVYYISGSPASVLTVFNAIDKAGAAAYLSSNGEAFTSRTAGYIINTHFPPGISNTGVGPLTGVGLSSLPFSDVNHFRPATAPMSAIPNTSLSGNPGGVPLYKNGILVGGVGVDSNALLSALDLDQEPNNDEVMAVMAQSGYAPPIGILATQVLINGLRLPYTYFNGPSAGFVAPNPANYVTNFLAPPILPVALNFPPTASTGVPFQTLQTNPFTDIPGGEVRNVIRSSPNATLVNGQHRLTKAEVTTILHQAAVRASTTRGAIRNPIGPAQVFIVVIDYYANTTTPNAPAVLGSFRTPDATLFSYDVAAQKARTALFFSNNTMAMSSRSVGFLAQGTYPPGIDGTVYGPYGPPTYGSSNVGFLTDPTVKLFSPPFGIQTAVSVDPTVVAAIGLTPINGYLPNGITVFPGGFPLYRNGVLIGAVGISGDGVDQDDLISASATVGFEAPTAIRADEFTYHGARLPYAKFPQNASL